MKTMKSLNEEIKRIKSLFNETRLYGNMISEGDCDDCSQSEMISKLKSVGFDIRKKDSVGNNMCESYNINNWQSVINDVKSVASSESLGSVEIFKDGGYGCSLALQFSKTYSGLKNSYVIQLWADGDWVASREVKIGKKIGTNKDKDNNDVDINKLVISGDWEWESDHIEFKGKFEKYKKNVVDANGEIIEVDSEKYIKAPSSWGSVVKHSFNKFVESFA